MAKYSVGLLEEELKNKVAADWFAAYDTTRIIGKVDFCVAIPATERGLFEAENALWAEAKAGVRKDIHESFVQLIRKFFQGVKVDAKGKEKMNATSGDADYNERLAALKSAMKKLAAKIQPKVYEYGFLKK